MAPPNDLQDPQPGLARERTQLAWIRTAISFAAVGVAILKTNPPAGLIVLAMCPLIWTLGRLSGDRAVRGDRRNRLRLITIGVTAVSLVTLVVVLL